MRVLYRFLVSLLVIFSFLFQVIGPLNATKLTKCPKEILEPKKIETPSDAAPELKKYVTSKFKNSIVSIESKSTLRSGIWWSAGAHKCYFDDKSIESGYTGFLPKGVENGYVTAVQLRKQLLSGGTTLFIRYYKQNGSWRIADSGTGP